MVRLTEGDLSTVQAGMPDGRQDKRVKRSA